MIIGSMKEVFLGQARNIFLFDCRVGGLDSPSMDSYRSAISSFIRFTGNILVKQLTPDHLDMYLANLSDGPIDDATDQNLDMEQYDLIQTWLHWIQAQNLLTDRTSNYITSPDLIDLFPRSAKSLAV
jgi:hypothetical protein